MLIKTLRTEAYILKNQKRGVYFKAFSYQFGREGPQRYHDLNQYKNPNVDVFICYVSLSSNKSDSEIINETLRNAKLNKKYLS